MVETSFDAGSAIITQGEDGDMFYVIRAGECSVETDGKVVAKLKGGDFFGENALLRDEPRTATITAKTKVEAYCINRGKFVELGLNEKLEFPKRGAVGGGAAAKVEIKAPSPKTPEEVELVTSALKKNNNLTTISALDDAKCKSMVDLMWKEDVKQGTEMIKQGDLNADYFYAIMSGEFEVMVAKDGKGQSADTAAATSMGVLKKGESFGELALMYLAPRAATIIAKTPAVVCIIDRTQFKQILSAASMEQSKQYIQYLDKVELLNPLNDNEKGALAKALIEMNFSKNEEIFKQGEKGEHFYILIEGSVNVVKDGTEVAKLEAPQCFGELALLKSEPRAATINVTSNGATTLVVDKASFDMLLGPLEELKKRGKNGTGDVKKVGAGPAGGEKRFGNIKRKELKRLGLLGCGGFGAVEMVEHVKSGEMYALKALSKGYVVKSGMQASVMSEKNVQLMCDSSFIVRLHETYNGDQSLYLLLELALGGELYATYNKKNMWGREDCARFYVAGTTFAFDHLHSKKIIFRDLKPENLLLNEHGAVKLTDMGLAKVSIGKTFTTCGTPDYFAPEIVASKGHTHAVDWWTLGILTFELLSGHPPFESATPMQIYQKVAKGINRVSFPKKCKGNAELLIKGLCNSNPSERLPMKKGDVKNIKDHAWYQGFDWDAMFNVTLKPPFVPVVKSKKDAGNFSARKEDMPPQIPYKDDKTGWDKDFATSV